MTSEITSAPGKLIALGEYAILEGSSALVLAVNRRAIAFAADVDAPPLSNFLASAEARCAELLGNADPPPIRVDTSAMLVGDRKLGLGSSAAATVAYVSARLCRAGHDFGEETLHPICHRAHADASAALGARGSGADIAAAVWGGAIQVTPAANRADPPSVRPMPHLGATWVAIDTGTSADTRELVSAVMVLKERDRTRYDAHIDALSGAACDGLEALESSNAGDFFAAFEASSAALAALGRDAGIELVTDIHRKIAQTARNHNGAAKSSGAGGGDAAIAVFDDESNARRFCGELVAAGIKPLDLDVDAFGVLVCPSTR